MTGFQTSTGHLAAELAIKAPRPRFEGAALCWQLDCALVRGASSQQPATLCARPRAVSARDVTGSLYQNNERVVGQGDFSMRFVSRVTAIRIFVVSGS